MKRNRMMMIAAGVLVLIASAPAFAQTVDERRANQADRISQGIRDGSLTAGEASRLEREQSAIAREEQRFNRDGTLNDAEKAKLTRDLNRSSNDIYNQRHDAQVNPNPNNPIDQRRANQEARIGAGTRDGSLTAGEAARLQGREARISRQEKRAKADGNFTPAEKRRLWKKENQASDSIYRERHDAQHR